MLESSIRIQERTSFKSVTCVDCNNPNWQLNLINGSWRRYAEE